MLFVLSNLSIACSISRTMSPPGMSCSAKINVLTQVVQRNTCCCHQNHLPIRLWLTPFNLSPLCTHRSFLFSLLPLYSSVLRLIMWMSLSALGRLTSISTSFDALKKKLNDDQNHLYRLIFCMGIRWTLWKKLKIFIPKRILYPSGHSRIWNQ